MCQMQIRMLLKKMAANHIYYKRWKNVNYNIFESPIALRSLMSAIEHIENIRKSQE